MHTKLIDWLYVFGILAAITWACVFPTWIGQSYTIYGSATNLATHESGTFGLEDDGGGYDKIAPIWSPPQPSSGLIDAPVRMPWESINSEYHVDFSISSTLLRIFLWSLGLGVLHWAAIAITRSEWSRIGSVAWSTSMMSIAGCLVMAVIVAFTMGYGLTDPVMITVMSVVTVAGILHGALLHKPNGAGTANTTWSRELGWTVLGIGIGFALMMVSDFTVLLFRPSVGAFTVDPTANLISGAAILLVAWITGGALWRTLPPSLRNGFLVSATILAVMCCIRF